MTDRVAYLLDTNVFSEMMRSAPNETVASFLDQTRVEGHGISVVTAWEIQNGIRRLDDGKRRRDLKHMFNGVLADLFADRVFPWDLSAASVCAEIMDTRRRSGRPLDDHLPDAIIASTARANGLTLVTRNVSEFENTGLDLINPWAA